MNPDDFKGQRAGCFHKETDTVCGSCARKKDKKLYKFLKQLIGSLQVELGEASVRQLIGMLEEFYMSED